MQGSRPKSADVVRLWTQLCSLRDAASRSELTMLTEPSYVHKAVNVLGTSCTSPFIRKRLSLLHSSLAAESGKDQPVVPPTVLAWKAAC